MQLNTSATMPLVVKPAGSGATLLFWPFRSNTSTVLPAAFPATSCPAALQAARWSSGMDKICCIASGASIIVAASPVARCQSMWQWKNQTPGLSALNRITKLLNGLTMSVSRRIGTAGKDDSLLGFQWP